ncbi:TonB-dependent hemoglobin/transferrin/lactoferrin family receptor [Neisseria sp. ZJ106]|uniref:TonB-dependent hemoglobin/transferrin/lactoferrin family receptor n=1 Tax=Neisseria lisongii TaxID=2912188 RepID=A0ABY7RJG8_9NEIS|nr:TonB-dependent hemoglobin/transferrin/lactoferrin family receptor [Neisseria lisongii]MCF7520629.1 TonB-dependent hemoglobin/transferrin/lactoferrin family receptor [Neisseria lisongii]WCL71437.1 TonB-dependent hemoglobin/transferrin/lactoferrin family receptor [Neisseria lisongii]
MMKKQMTFKPTVLFILLSSAFSAQALHAETALSEPDADIQLKTVEVKGNKTAAKLGTEKIRRQKLDEYLIQDIHDMVRYDPGISVTEGGRAGSNGFAVRGVDKDRVAVSVDGLAQAESRSSEAFQELFGAYGNFNTNRNAAELENISEVAILKGADSLTAGSGALGGAVLYKTKSPKDYLQDGKNYYIGLKGGYSSKSSQWMSSTTLAGRAGNADGLFVFTRRHGHETRNHGGGADTVLDYTDENSFSYKGVARATPDPQNTASKSTLVKLGYHFTPSNYLSGVYEDYRQDRKTDELSNLFSYISQDKRLRNDVSYRKRTGLQYENHLENGPWDSLKLNADKQQIDMTTMTWDIPLKENIQGRNTEVFFRRRGLYQNLNQFQISAEKHADWHNISWDTSYGAGLSKGKYRNSNLEYFALLFYPDILGSKKDTNEFLVSTENKKQHIYWDNTIRFGDKVKLGLGARYDKVNMNTLESDSLTPNVKRQLVWQNIWDKQASFKAPSYSASLDWNIVPSLTLQSKYSTAFRSPTTDEMWFFFPHRDFYVQPNPDLKDERSKNIELGIDWHGKWGNLKLSGFRTRYKNFIDFVYIGGIQHETLNSNGDIVKESWISPTYQNRNRNNAVVKGLELQGRWDLNSIGLPDGTYTNIAASYIKGSADNDIPLNALQPFNAVWGIGYKHPGNRWGIGTNLSYFARKKAEDTSRAYDKPNEPWPFVKHSRNVFLVDLIGHYQFGKNVSLRSGIFNLFNKKYYTWDTLRSIREFGTVNRVHNQTHGGIERFSAPGRNFNITLEAKF